MQKGFCNPANEDFRGIVLSSWREEVTGNTMRRLFAKMKRLKPHLRELNKRQYADISKRRDVEKERLLRADLLALERAETSFYQPIAKDQWLKEGYIGTKFFHSTAMENKKRNTIRLLKDASGKRLETFEEMSTEMVNFYIGLIGTSNPDVRGSLVEHLKELVHYDLPSGAAEELEKEVSDAEIKDVLFKQGNDKSPDPDGYSEILFFERLPAFNVTAIVLIPKALNTCLAKIFRPISYCYVIYKTVTRILVMRLALYFTEMISPNQSAFIKGRSIVENTLLAQELIKGSYGLLETFRGWIRACVTTFKFQFLLMQVWSDVLVKLGIMRFLGSILSAEGFPFLIFVLLMTCSFFVTVPLILCLGLRVLEQFYVMSRLKLNVAKTDFFASGIDNPILREMQVATSFKLGILPVRYPGVPSVTRKLSEKECFPLLEKIRGELGSDRGGLLAWKIEQMYMYFWEGSDEPAKEARVRWQQECLMKFEEGLGIRNLLCSNKTCSLLLVRNILNGDKSLWIASVGEYAFKGEDFWRVECKPHFSWTLRKVLRLRREAKALFEEVVNRVWLIAGGLEC
ncbi:uncharacterized protein LOC120192271 [Hibiscus syriacus]|uniref:uncharacterized protein LOC120192271 n=1 Tax=Hibiscus syriacus TaxID=106335 RepID=UPI0019239606|nr:uncharacterized protein LOC120192271 [Hibiscus syriacus]